MEPLVGALLLILYTLASIFLYMLLTGRPATSRLLGRIRGYTEGRNTAKDGKKMIMQDLAAAHKSFLVVSCKADTIYWDDEVVRKMQEKCEKEKVKFRFIVGPELGSSLIEPLASCGTIELRLLNDRPPCDLRVIDEKETYVANHSIPNAPKSKRFYRTFRGSKAVMDRMAEFNKLLALSRPYSKSA